MDILIYASIIIGCGLMAFNIVRYFMLARRIRAMHIVKGFVKVYLPLFLLVFFLAGCIAVALFGKPDIIIAGILSGGSLFVFILLAIIYSIVDRLIENDLALSNRFGELKGSLDALTKDSLAVFTVNLTRDVIEERAGTELTATDLLAGSYSELLSSRQKNLISKPFGERDDLFQCEGLIRQYREGVSFVSEAVLVRRANGHIGFSELSASLAEQPGTGDITAFITERDANRDMVNKTVIDRVLADQNDIVAFIESGRYTVLAGDGGSADSLLPAESSGDYCDYVNETILPKLVPDESGEAPDPSVFCLDGIIKGVSENGSYEISAVITEDGRSYYKRIFWYPVGADADFYLMLVKDTTELHRERTEQNERLKAALDSANRANKAKTMFFSNISHDIRTPMGAITGFTEMAMRSDDPEKTREHLQKIAASGEYLLSLINDLLELSRIESEKLTLVDAPCDLRLCMSEVRDVFGEQMKKKSLEFPVSEKGLEHPFVICDRTRLERVLFNLVGNALKFTPEGGRVEVVLEETGVKDGMGSYSISVSDTGVGMTPEFAAKVFDAFSRDRTSDQQRIQGTGLGMSITKSIAELMGGTISVRTEKDRGTEFTVSLLLPLGEEAGMRAAEEPADPLSLLKIAGVNMASPKPIEDGLKLFNELLDEMVNM